MPVLGPRDAVVAKSSFRLPDDHRMIDHEKPARVGTYKTVSSRLLSELQSMALEVA